MGRYLALIVVVLSAASAQAAPGRIFIDAGHGVGSNQGAQTLLCGTEGDFTLEVARDLQQRLKASRRWQVQLSRTSSIGPSYRSRLRAARRFGAQALLSVHADVRGSAEYYAPEPGQRCLKNDAQPGFSVLVSDDASHLMQDRFRLARAVAKAMTEAGFVAYDGVDYEGLYLADSIPGVFIDRRGLLMLRRPSMPSVIIETHHALHPGDYALWQTKGARAAFALAIDRGLQQALTQDE